MNNIVLTNIMRFFGLLLLQVLVFQSLSLDSSSTLGYFHILIYPLFILLLPHDTKHWILILLGFILGMSIDLFYHSYGVHASASVLTATLRPFILRLQEPKGGYPKGQSPTKYRLGAMPYLRYVGLLLLIHIIWYHSMEFFTLAYIDKIALRTIVSFPFSLLFVFVHAFLINPKN